MLDLDLRKYGIADEWPRLAKLQAEIRDLELARAKAQSEVVAATNAIPVAQQRDAEADAKAIRAAKSGPRAQHAAKARATLEDAERTLSAYEKAAQDAQADLGTFIAKHRDALRAAIAGALNQNARELAHHARKAAELYGFLEDARYDVKRLAPPPPPPDENAPAQRLSTTVIGVTTQRAAGPNRGDVEQMLAYLASLAAPEPQDSAA
jgi:flagellar hook-length control protein FliK